MTEKTRIIDALGEPTLLLPGLVGKALAANDRAKFYLSLLQAAQTQAADPRAFPPPLVAERLADDSLDGIPARSTVRGPGLFYIPQAESLCTRLAAELATMFAPIRSAGLELAPAYAARLAALNAAAWGGPGDTLSSAQLARLASADRDAGDSAHLLVMEMHKTLNLLQARIASEDIDGAAAYNIEPNDRPLIAAFMRGVSSTRPLKFDHPGLGTTATRSGAQLILQNDIGTTDAHVLVVHVEARCITLIYSDVHIQRLAFFQSLFGHWAVSWEDTRSRTDSRDGVYHLALGKFTANNEAGLSDYLAFLGSRLVFLIDWNRARKRLRLLLPKRETALLLKWAADENIGHMGWLCSGAEQMVFDALAFAARTPPAFGARLDDMLDPGKAVSFMQFVLRTCTNGQLDSRGDETLRDEIRAELATCFRSARHQLIDIVAEHAALSIELASGIRDCLLELSASGAGERIAFNAGRARDWEHRADELVNLARELNHQRAEHADFYRSLIESADDIADELEEAAFHLTLFPPDPPAAELQQAFSTLAGLAVSSAQEFLKAIETARGLRRGGPREDLQDFLAAIHLIIAAERHSDDAHRRFKAVLATGSTDFRSHYVFAEFAQNLESAADVLLRSGLQLRDHVMTRVTSE